MLCYIVIKFLYQGFVEKMLILGIDTSCDDTAAAIVENGRRIISNAVSSQNEIHEKYGGIVPELASRRHIEMIWPVVDEALNSASLNFSDLSAVSVTYAPGLIGSLLVGVCFAKSLSFVNNLPLIAVNHLEGHIFSTLLEHNPKFPFLTLIASGGHTSIYIVSDVGHYTEVGRTRDDAAGEAYDKVAKLLGLGYPGGPFIDILAAEGDPEAISFPRAKVQDSLDFSFSGLKTAVLYHVKNNPDTRKEDIAASFQAAVTDVLINRVIEISKKENIVNVALSGGVSANSCLRAIFRKTAAEKGWELYIPSRHLCTDNAAMIASAGYYRFKRVETADMSLNPKAYLPLA
jgi:N6-L-threonylcarbamoyladenine synthase